MTGMVAWLPWAVASYLLGAIPTSYLVVRAVKGQDLRSLGSGNLGATNLYRQLGWRYAVPVGLFDLAKGALPVVAARSVGGASAGVALALGAAAVVGHVYSVFVGFRGGKGVATGAGVVLGLAPWAFVGSLVVWAVVVRLSGYVSLGSVLAALAFPVIAWLAHPGQRHLAWMYALLAGLIIVLHRANLRRLLAGTEHRFGGPHGGAAAGGPG